MRRFALFPRGRAPPGNVSGLFKEPGVGICGDRIEGIVEAGVRAGAWLIVGTGGR
jgi:hypothetical protein